MAEKKNSENKQHYALIASIWAVGTALIIVAMKGYAYLVTDSVAMLGSLSDSLSDIAISVMMLMAVRYSMKPADHDHRHGHGKIEGLAAVFQGAFLFGAAVFVGMEAVRSINDPQVISGHMIGAAVSIFAIILTLVLIFVQRWAVRHSGSLAVEADSHHYTSDVLLNGGVLIGFAASYYNAPQYLDICIALAISAYMIRSAYKVAREGADMLLDRELCDDTRDKIIKIIQGHKEISGLHDLRTRRSGMSIHISFDIEVDPELSLRAAHDITRDVEHELLDEFPNAEIIIHVDPYDDISDSRHKVKSVHMLNLR